MTSENDSSPLGTSSQGTAGSRGRDEAEDVTLERIRGLLDFVARSLVDLPDDVDVRVVNGERDAVVFELSVGEGDLGKVIGKEGRTARAMRTILSASSAKLRRRAILEILE